MAAFPSWARYGWRDFSEEPDSVVQRTEMDRGPAKQRRIASDARVEVHMTLYFDTSAEIDSFETWFYTTINAGQDRFDWTHPRTGATLLAMVVGGKLGKLVPLNRTLALASRELVIEYWRSAW